MPKRRSGAYLSIVIAYTRAGERPNAAGIREGKLGLGSGQPIALGGAGAIYSNSKKRPSASLDKEAGYY